MSNHDRHVTPPPTSYEVARRFLVTVALDLDRRIDAASTRDPRLAACLAERRERVRAWLRGADEGTRRGLWDWKGESDRG